MRGGQYVNNWRMAELHAKEAPDRVRELEGWGAVFDRTPDGRINQRNFGGHRYPRLAHVGDRTGLELIRTLQDHTVYLGVTVHMEHTVIELLLDGGRAAGVLAYDRERGRFHVFSAKAVVLATGGVGRAYKITSNSWEGTGDGHALAYRAGAELIDMEFIQFHPTGHGLAAERQRHPRHRRRARRRRRAARTAKAAASCSTTSPTTTSRRPPSDPEEGWRYTQGDKSARRPPELLTRDHVARCINREVKAGRGSPARRRVPRHRVDQGEAAGRRGAHQAQAAEHVPPVQGAGRPRHHEGADGSRARPRTTSWAASAWTPTRRSRPFPGLFAAGECAAGINGANRLGGNSLSDLIVFGKRAGEYAAQFAREERRRRSVDDARRRARR